MGSNKFESPSDEEIDEFVELYEEEGTIKGVADQVNWSRKTVSKWLKDRGVVGDNGSSSGSDSSDGGDSDTSGGPDPTAGQGGSPPIQTAESPNDVLRRVIETDPKLGEDELEWIEIHMEDHGVLSTSNVAQALNQLSISNKHMTINRVTERYANAVNRKLREQPSLQQQEDWAILLTKETGQPYHSGYNQQGYGQQQQAGNSGIAPPPQQQGQNPAGASISAPPQQAGQPQQQPTRGATPQPNGAQEPEPEPTPETSEEDEEDTVSEAAYPGRTQIQPPGQQPMRGQQAPQGQVPPNPQQSPQDGGSDGDDSMSPLEEMAMEMIRKEMMDGDTSPEPEPEPQEPQSEVEELIERQEELQQLIDLFGAEEDSDGGIPEELAEAVNGLNQRIAQLESKVESQESASDPTPSIEMDTGGNSPGFGLGEIAQLAQTVEDDDLVKQVLKMQQDPDVIEAERKRQEALQQSEWKKSLVESLSPAATEKAVETLASLSSGLMQGASQAQQGAPQQPQAQQPQQPQQAEPEPAARQPAEPEQQSRGSSSGAEGSVAVVDSETATDSASVSGSPQRRRHVQAAADGDDADEEGAETSEAEETVGDEEPDEADEGGESGN